jgi:predicted CXXCH cytochrome family protein
LLLVASCDEGKRHNVLTFFFDGVPPLPGEVSGAGSSAPSGTEPAAAPVQTWWVHEPLKDCTLCHGRQPRRGFSSKVQLVAEVPQLCYQCHEEFTALKGWVHGPVAAGDCLLCHEQHKSRNEALLIKPVPELCYQCHEVQAIHTIDQHGEESYQHCTDCHDGHASTARALLRPTVAAQEEPPAAAPVVPAENATDRPADIVTTGDRPGSEESTPAAAEDRPESPEPAAVVPPDRRGSRERAMAELYYRSIKQYHAGQLREARQGLLETRESGLLPDPMRETVDKYLEAIKEALGPP